MGYIYKITNLINNKVYIGQTSRTIATRWSQHKNSSLTVDTHLYRAMRKYGIENFIIEPIEETVLLNEREIYWISYYNSFEKGYNMTQGGEGFGRQMDYDLLLKEWNNGLTLTDISNKTGHAPKHIRAALQSQGVSTEEIKQRGLKIAAQKHSIDVYQFDLDGNFIQHFQSIREAGHCVNCNPTNILNCCNQKALSAAGFLWSYNKQIDQEIVNKKKNFSKGGKKLKRAVKQFDKNGNYIRTFSSVSEAARSVNGYATNISDVCNHKTKTAYNYIWAYDQG